jgi:hypothetical protein
MARIVAVALIVVGIALTGCGDDGDGATGTESTTSSTDPGSTTGSDGSTTSGTDGSPTTLDPADLPGEPFDLFPYEGAKLAVVGVAADDTLKVRTGPGTEFEVAMTLDPLHQGAVATGRNRQIEGGGIWAEISDGGRTGWANTAFLLQPGQVTDETAARYPTPADRPTAPTMEELAATVAQASASQEPPSKITIVDGPTVGDLGEVTVDVIGLGDDAAGGVRLHLFAEPSGGSFTLRTVEQTVLCSRGVTDDGLCV